MRVVPGCGGWCVYWPGKVGETLQGWYANQADADRAWVICQKYLDDKERS